MPVPTQAIYVIDIDSIVESGDYLSYLPFHRGETGCMFVNGLLSLFVFMWLYSTAIL